MLSKETVHLNCWNYLMSVFDPMDIGGYEYACIRNRRHDGLCKLFDVDRDWVTKAVEYCEPWYERDGMEKALDKFIDKMLEFSELPEDVRHTVTARDIEEAASRLCDLRWPSLGKNQ